MENAKMVKGSKAQAIRKSVQEFSGLLTGAVESLKRASVVYAEAVEKYGDEAHFAFKEAYPGVTASTWDKMRLVAKKSIIPELLLLTDKVGARIARLSYDAQRKMLGGKKRLKVCTPSGAVKEKTLAELTEDEENRLFSETGKIRTPSEQREWMAQKTASRKVGAAYTIQGNVLIVHRATRFGKAELLEILGKMK